MGRCFSNLCDFSLRWSPPRPTSGAGAKPRQLHSRSITIAPSPQTHAVLSLGMVRASTPDSDASMSEGSSRAKGSRGAGGRAADPTCRVEGRVRVVGSPHGSPVDCVRSMRVVFGRDGLAFVSLQTPHWRLASSDLAWANLAMYDGLIWVESWLLDLRGLAHERLAHLLWQLRAWRIGPTGMTGLVPPRGRERSRFKVGQLAAMILGCLLHAPSPQCLSTEYGC